MRLLQRLQSWRKMKGAEGARQTKFADKPDPKRTIRVIPAPYTSLPLSETRILNDDSVYTVYNLFGDILLGGGWRFVGEDAGRLQELTDAIVNAPGWSQTLDELAAAPFQRFAVVEIVWETGRTWTPAALRPLPRAAVSLDLDEFNQARSIRVSTSDGLQTLPPENFILFRWRATIEKPLGQSVYDRLKEVIQFKRRTDEAIVRYIERFAGPTVIAWYPPGMSDEDQSALLTAVKNLRSASYGALPGPRGDDGASIELLEASGQGPITVAQEMIRQYERRIARAVLGSVLAVFESEYGTRAQSEVHWQVLKAVVQSYQTEIEEPLNQQLLQPVIRYNVGQADVQFRLNPPSFADLQKLAQTMADLAQAGVLDLEADRERIRGLFGLDE
jgi:phage gp29-like protein